VPDAFVLLRAAGDHDAAPFARAFAALGAPFAVMDVPEPEARAIWGRDLVLVRPDLHVAWRGNALPANPDHIARVLTGHSRLEDA
jgi:hypothetical protein